MKKPVFQDLIASVDRRRRPRAPIAVDDTKRIGQARADELWIDLHTSFPRCVALLESMREEERHDHQTVERAVG